MHLLVPKLEIGKITSLGDGYYQNNGTLPAHLDRFTAKGVEVSVGSLGHGFNMGLGIAYGFKKKKENRKVYVWKAFGWEVYKIDGHDFAEINHMLDFRIRTFSVKYKASNE